MPSMSRKERERETRRKEILEAARAVIAQKGVAGATLEEIAEKADYKPATLYLYFSSKDDLLANLYLSVMQQGAMIEIEALAAKPMDDPLQKLYMLPDLYARIYLFDREVLLSLLYMQAGKSYSSVAPETLEKLNKMARRGVRGTAKIFAECLDRGLLKPASPIVLFDALWSLFVGVVLWEESKRIFNPSKDNVESTLRSAMKTLIEGMIKNPTD